MTKFLPLFPLNIVVFPGENLNLHIFEPRYKQLILECVQEKKAFGIPSIQKGKMAEFGTSVEVISVEKTHESGELDIKTKGKQLFKILEYIQHVPDKLYSGAIVNFPEQMEAEPTSSMQNLLIELRNFHSLLQINKKYSVPDEELKAFDIAHHVGLSVEQEYELLQLETENMRQAYLIRHLQGTIPTLVELQNLKERIQLNGHYRKLSIEE